jgi:hypothetical protein
MWCAAKMCLGFVLAAGLVACDSMELTIGVTEGADGQLEVVNTNGRVLEDVRLVVEAFESEGATRPCDEVTRARWGPDEAIPVPACAEKTRITLTADGETARFSYSKGQLFRRIGRKEVPISR